MQKTIGHTIIVQYRTRFDVFVKIEYVHEVLDRAYVR